MSNYNEIQLIMEEYTSVMDKLIVFENNKLQAIDEKNNELLDKFLKDEQVYLLQLKGLDQKRETLQKKLGIEGLTYRNIIDITDIDHKSDMEATYQILASKIEEFKNLTEAIKTYIDLRLHTIDALMEKFGAAPIRDSQSGIYDRISGQSENNVGSGHSGMFQSTKV